MALWARPWFFFKSLYEMRMKKLFILTALGSALAQTALAQTPMPYFTGFDTPAQTNGWEMIRKGLATPLQVWYYESISAYTAPKSLGHSYPVGGVEETNDWMVSPPFSFPDGGTIDSLRFSFSGFGTPHEGDTVAIYLLTGSPDPALATGMVMLYDFRDEQYIKDNQWHKVAPISIPPTAGTSYIAFRYNTIINWLDVKFDNLAISSLSEPPSSITNKEQAYNVLLYPNPSRGKVDIQSPVPFQTYRVVDMTGRTLIQDVNPVGMDALYVHQPISSTIDISALPSGVYFVMLDFGNGNITRSKLVKGQ